MVADDNLKHPVLEILLQTLSSGSRGGGKSDYDKNDNDNAPPSSLAIDWLPFSEEINMRYWETY